MKIQKLKDGSRARDYLLEYVPFGFAMVDKLAQHSSDFARGSFFVISPENVDADSLAYLGWSISGSVDRPAAIQLFGKVVKRFISNPNCTVLLYDFTNAITDPGWEEYKHKDRATIYNGEICWELKGPDTPDHEIEELISDWSSYFPVSSYFCVSSSSERKNTFNDADLEQLSGNLIGVALDALHGDSFVIWWRDDLQPFPL